ncbi:hypothetical protein ABAC460_07725 [Asticcacaulis sp. AC460]|uniref:hypothetical protein n=1 Tax=Asticcacaulis sp. AC460 TaxID=1282360 RepID=UPI0003C3FA8B|nr:hypothetical protein [Asticcacaulis sp. AC460]ESQ90709.1 hypothetical protein ABAC460_07725 [Asticcacaulis sp. AC460]
MARKHLLFSLIGGIAVILLCPIVMAMMDGPLQRSSSPPGLAFGGISQTYDDCILRVETYAQYIDNGKLKGKPAKCVKTDKGYVSRLIPNLNQGNITISSPTYSRNHRRASVEGEWRGTMPPPQNEIGGGWACHYINLYGAWVAYHCHETWMT